MYCSECGKKILEDSEKCLSCGAVNPAAERRFPGWLIAILVVVIIICILMALALIAIIVIAVFVALGPQIADMFEESEVSSGTSTLFSFLRCFMPF